MFFRDPFVATELPLSSGSLDQSYLPTPKVPFLFSASSLCPRFFQPPLLFLFPLSPLVVRCPTSALPLPPPCFLGYFNLRLPRQFPFRLPRPFFTPYLPLLQASSITFPPPLPSLATLCSPPLLSTALLSSSRNVTEPLRISIGKFRLRSNY